MKMSTEAYDVDQGLRHLVDTGRISLESLTAMTGIPPTALHEYLSAEHRPGMTAAPAGLSASQTSQLSMLSVLLTVGLSEDDDVRLRALVETLTLQFELTHENIALLIDAEATDVETAAHDAAKLSASKKYRLAVRLSYLVTAIGNAGRRSS
jgi:hypothetical protein